MTMVDVWWIMPDGADTPLLACRNPYEAAARVAAYRRERGDAWRCIPGAMPAAFAPGLRYGPFRLGEVVA